MKGSCTSRTERYLEDLFFAVGSDLQSSDSFSYAMSRIVIVAAVGTALYFIIDSISYMSC